LDKDLGQPDHLSIAAQLFCEIDHSIASILLRAGSWCSKQGAESLNGDGVALLSTTGRNAGFLPLGSRFSDNLGDTSIKSDGCRSDLDVSDNCSS